MKTKINLINSFKASIAIAIGYFASLLLQHFFPQPIMGMWIEITILVVMSTQPNVGGAINKGVLRLVGTYTGVATGLLILWLAGNHELLIVLGVMVAAFCYVYLAGYNEKASYIGVLGGITVVIVCLAHEKSLVFSLNRALEITIGILIALAVNVFVLPIRANKQLNDLIADCLEHLAHYASMGIRLQKNDNIAQSAVLLTNFAGQINLFAAAKHEHRQFPLATYQMINMSLREISRYLYVFREYLREKQHLLDNGSNEQLILPAKEHAFLGWLSDKLQQLSQIYKQYPAWQTASLPNLLDFDEQLRTEVQAATNAIIHSSQDENFYIHALQETLGNLVLNTTELMTHFPQNRSRDAVQSSE